MTKQSKNEYIENMLPRYRAANKDEQGTLLDEMIKVTGYHRKSIIRRLHKKMPLVYPKAVIAQRAKTIRGRPKTYGAGDLLAFLITLWHATGQACGKRLKRIIPLWLPWYEKTFLAKGQNMQQPLSLEHQVLLTRISAATIDRLLGPERRKYRIGKGRCTTKPGTLSLRQQIPIKTGQWQETRPGFLEDDTVAHCGTSLAGQFAYSLNAVDVASGWTETAAAWGKGETGILEAFTAIEEDLPFPLRGMDSDNGTEFINHHMNTYLRSRPKGKKVQQTRSREYKKNDNAHIEQKNWTHVRQLFGYARFDNPLVVPLMNDLYRNEYRLLMNFFLPSVKLKDKERIGSKIIKRHDAPTTPVDRLLAMRSISDEVKKQLRQQRDPLNPFLLRQEIERKRKIILSVATLPAVPPESAASIPPAQPRTNHQPSKPERTSLPRRAPAPPTKPGCPRGKKKTIKKYR